MYHAFLKQCLFGTTSLMSVYHTLTISIVGLYSRCKHGRKAGANRRNNHDPRFLRILKLINTLKEEEQLTSLSMRSGIVPVDNGRVLPGRSTVLATSQQAQSAVKQIQQSFCNLVIIYRYIYARYSEVSEFGLIMWSPAVAKFLLRIRGVDPNPLYVSCPKLGHRLDAPAELFECLPQTSSAPLAKTMSSGSTIQ